MLMQISAHIPYSTGFSNCNMQNGFNRYLKDIMDCNSLVSCPGCISLYKRSICTCIIHRDMNVFVMSLNLLNLSVTNNKLKNNLIKEIKRAAEN